MPTTASAAKGVKRRAIERTAANTSGTAIHVDEGDGVLHKPDGWDADAAALAQEGRAKLEAAQLAEDQLAGALDHLSFKTTWQVRERAGGGKGAAAEGGNAAMTYAINIIVGAPCRNGGLAFVAGMKDNCPIPRSEAVMIRKLRQRQAKLTTCLNNKAIQLQARWIWHLVWPPDLDWVSLRETAQAVARERALSPQNLRVIMYANQGLLEAGRHFTADGVDPENVLLVDDYGKHELEAQGDIARIQSKAADSLDAVQLKMAVTSFQDMVFPWMLKHTLYLYLCRLYRDHPACCEAYLGYLVDKMSNIYSPFYAFFIEPRHRLNSSRVRELATHEPDGGAVLKGTFALIAPVIDAQLMAREVLESGMLCHAPPSERARCGRELWQLLRERQGHVAREALRASKSGASERELEAERRCAAAGFGYAQPSLRTHRFQVVPHDDEADAENLLVAGIENAFDLLADGYYEASLLAGREAHAKCLQRHNGGKKVSGLQGKLTKAKGVTERVMLGETVADEFFPEGKGWQTTWDEVFVDAGLLTSSELEHGIHAPHPQIKQATESIADAWTAGVERHLHLLQESVDHPLSINFDRALRWIHCRRPSCVEVNGAACEHARDKRAHQHTNGERVAHKFRHHEPWPGRNSGAARPAMMPRPIDADAPTISRPVVDVANRTVSLQTEEDPESVLGPQPVPALW